MDKCQRCGSTSTQSLSTTTKGSLAMDSYIYTCTSYYIGVHGLAVANKTAHSAVYSDRLQLNYRQIKFHKIAHH